MSTFTSDQANEHLANLLPIGARKLLGSEIIEVGGVKGRAAITHQARADFCAAHGVTLNSVLCAMMDEAMAMAASTLRDLGCASPTLGMNATLQKGPGAGAANPQRKGVPSRL